METRSAGWGVASLLLATAFVWLRRHMATLPFGENDFDLYLLGITISSAGLLAVSISVMTIGVATGVYDSLRSRPQWVPIMGLVGSLAATTLIAWSLTAPL